MLGKEIKGAQKRRKVLAKVVGEGAERNAEQKRLSIFGLL